MTFLFWLGIAALTAWSVAGIALVRGSRHLESLSDIVPGRSSDLPPVSIIAAARNEERNLREALASLLRLDYPRLEYILVNDRSEDGTGAILDEMAGADYRLKIVHVTELPSGWLGKNHALWTGSGAATGELFLFTDADLVMAPSTLGRAVTLLQRDRLDHLAIAPETRMPGFLLNAFAGTFALFFSLFVRPWQARNPRSAAHIGIGAFNLVRAQAYREAGGHRAIRLRPDDDLKLGKILKKKGFRQDVAFGAGFLQVQWYGSLRELIHGLEKNAFSGADYRVPVILFGAVFHLSASVWPYLAVFVTTGATRAVYAATVAVITFLFVHSTRLNGLSPRYALGFPLTAALFVYIILRTMVLNLARGGIVWRGTFYSLRELRSNKV